MKKKAAWLAAGPLLLACGIACADHPSVDFGTGGSGSIATIAATTQAQGSTALGIRTTLVRPERLSDTVLRDRADRHIHAHATRYMLGAALAGSYGSRDDFTIAFSLPYVRRADIRAGEHDHDAGGAALNTVIDHGDSAGIGDLTLLGKYRLAGDENRLASALLFGIKLPTGETRERDSRGERFETEHQPGTGSWDPIVGLALTKRIGAITFDASFVYTFATKGSQRTQLGNRASYGVGASYRFGAGDDHHHGDAGAAPHSHRAWDVVLELNGEWEGRQEIDGVRETESASHVVYLSPGLRFVSSAGWSAAVSIGIPVSQHVRLAHPEIDYRVLAALSWSI